MAIERVSNTFEDSCHLHYCSPGRHFVCVKGCRVTGTVFLSLLQRKYFFPQTFNSIGDHHCKIFGIWWTKVDSNFDLHFWISREAEQCCIIFYNLFVYLFCELPVLYCPIFNGDACLLNKYPIRVLFYFIFFINF